MASLSKDVFSFLADLSRNNQRDWFEANKPLFENSKKNVLQWFDETLVLLSEIDPALSSLKASDCLYRIYRDTRFSPDKTPYKDHFGLYFTKAGRKFGGAGYYIHLHPEEVFIGAGCWMPDAEWTKNIRQEIDFNAAEFSQIMTTLLGNGYSSMTEGKLSRPPKGYDVFNEAIQWLKLKSWIVTKSFHLEIVTEGDFSKAIANAVADTKVLVDFINRCEPGLES